jgi:hypothetical protein
MAARALAGKAAGAASRPRAAAALRAPSLGAVPPSLAAALLAPTRAARPALAPALVASRALPPLGGGSRRAAAHLGPRAPPLWLGAGPRVPCLLGRDPPTSLAALGGPGDGAEIHAGVVITKQQGTAARPKAGKKVSSLPASSGLPGSAATPATTSSAAAPSQRRSSARPRLLRSPAGLSRRCFSARAHAC